MRRTIKLLIGFMLLAMLVISCQEMEGSSKDNGSEMTTTPVVFQNAVQTSGTSGIADSTGLTLTFSVDLTTLTTENIALSGATKGELSGTGTTRTLAISNIRVDNGKTVSISITSPSGFTLTGSPQTAVVYRAPYIGMAYQGGKIAYILQPGDPVYVSGQTHGLIAATRDAGGYIQWYNGSYTTTGATGTALGTGQANTTAIVTNQGAGDYAAKVCYDYTNIDTGTGVYSDWYLPSKDELNKLCINSGAIGGFVGNYYWSSSEDSSNNMNAWTQFFNGVDSGYYNTKYFERRVRPVRAF